MYCVAVVAQQVEHSHGKGKVRGSSPRNGSRRLPITIILAHSCFCGFLSYTFGRAEVAQLVEQPLRKR